MSYQQPLKPTTSGTSIVSIQNSTYTYAVDAQASDAYVIALSTPTTAYVAGQVFRFKANTANTGASSLNVDGLGAKTIKKNHDQDTATGDIEAGAIVTVAYDGTNFQLLSADNNVTQDEIGDGVTNRSYTDTEKTKLAGIATGAQVNETHAVASDLNTGTDTTKPVDSDALAGSYAGTKVVEVVAFDFTTDVAVGDGAAYFLIPASLNGMNLVSVSARVITAGTTGTTDVQIANVTDTTDMLSTKMTIDSTEVSTSTAATPAVIDTTKDDVVTNDLLRIDVDATSTTKAKGLIVSMEFRLP